MDQEKLFTKQNVLLIFFGLAVNILFTQLTLALHLPFYLDSVGTILAGALGGFLPGIIVGFFSNAINSIGDPITLYYGIVSILFGVLSAALSRRGAFRRVWSALLSALLFALVGGGLGSLLSWALYGLSIGTGLSSAFAIRLHDAYGFTPFLAQLASDLWYDLIDKLITMLLVFSALRVRWRWMLENVPLGGIYLPAEPPSPPSAGPDAG